jgi:glycosyltransferase involved in cell wall biosynthesis
MLKKILQLHSSSGFFGAENVIANLILELADGEFQPIMGVFNNIHDPHLELADFAEKHAIETQIFNCRATLDLQTIAALRKYIRDHRIALVHTHGYKSDFYALLATRNMAVPCIATCHPWIKTSRKSVFYSRVDKRILRRFDHIVAIGERVRKEILESGVTQNRISVIDNGINFRAGVCSKKSTLQKKITNRSPKIRVIGTLGRLEVEKGHSVLITAFTQLVRAGHDVTLIIGGEGSLRGALEHQVMASDLQQKVQFLGYVHNRAEFFSKLDLFVLPSLTEGLPMALLEAMAAQKAIVATMVGDVPRVLTQEECGLLVPAGAAAPLAEAMARLLCDSGAAHNFAVKAGEKVINEFSSSRMAENYRMVYHRFT